MATQHPGSNTACAGSYIIFLHLSFLYGGILLKLLLLSKLLTSRSNMRIWITRWHKHRQIPQYLLYSPSTGLPGMWLPSLKHQAMLKPTAKVSLTGLSRWVTFPCLDDRSLLVPKRKQKSSCVLTYICVCVYAYMYGYTHRYVNILSKIVTYRKRHHECTSKQWQKTSSEA